VKYWSEKVRKNTPWQYPAAFLTTILADAAERADEIDIARAEAAKRRAEESLTGRTTTEMDMANVEASLRRALARIKVAEKRRQRRPKI
jgi:hypothetical protein